MVADGNAFMIACPVAPRLGGEVLGFMISILYLMYFSVDPSPATEKDKEEIIESVNEGPHLIHGRRV